MKRITLLLAPDAAPSAAPVAQEYAPVSEQTMAASLSASLASLAAESGAPVAASAAIESPAVTTSPTAADPAASPATPETVPASATADELDAPFAPEVLATLGEAGQRALQSEREKRKEARKELAELKAKLAALESKSSQPEPTAAAPSAEAAESAEPEAAAEPETPRVSESAPVPTALAECKTFAEVDAMVRTTLQQKGLATELNTVLATVGLDAVVQRFEEQNIQSFRGIPLAKLTPEILARELSTAITHADEVLFASSVQKQNIETTQRVMAQAVTILPGLKDPKSAVRREFNDIANNPAVRALGPQWPLLVAQTIVGRQTLAKPAPAPAAPVAPKLPPVPTPVPVAAPAAPKTSIASMTGVNEVEQIAKRAAEGKATAQDMARYASANMGF